MPTMGMFVVFLYVVFIFGTLRSMFSASAAPFSLFSSLILLFSLIRPSCGSDLLNVRSQVSSTFFAVPSLFAISSLPAISTFSAISSLPAISTLSAISAFSAISALSTSSPFPAIPSFPFPRSFPTPPSFFASSPRRGFIIE
eukprot:TRINITY_DN129_c0_g1_i2.p4 TRINITY_DN129_c0_g1~~TRINITY_DN129_c0_g1_i2.p4  ORF type:complete len:142 (+),score=38.30 TRINITY_DN129_c0_g1_i2:292-717(+)